MIVWEILGLVTGVVVLGIFGVLARFVFMLLGYVLSGLLGVLLVLLVWDVYQPLWPG